ncbi:MAG: hypothetical protein F6K41_31425 [Symploca sp. SIO3E6]|nr:hypothetical protein [Caldora sp. SIO3E6]
MKSQDWKSPHLSILNSQFSILNSIMDYRLFWANLYGTAVLTVFAIAGTATALWSVTPVGSVIFVGLIILGVIVLLAK